MRKTYFVGIDVASETFVASVLMAPDQQLLSAKEFGNTPEGVADLEAWLLAHAVSREEAVLCMEATGVYGESLAYRLTAQKWWLAVHPPLEVKRAFHPTGHKNDAVDSRQIAEYAARFRDRLRPFRPRKAILEQIKVLLNLREQYVRQKTAHKNALKTIQRKVVGTPLAEKLHQQTIGQLEKNIKTIEREIKQLLKQDPGLHMNASLLSSIQGVGLLLTAHTLVLMETLQSPLNPKTVAAYIGISPYENSSGTSLKKRPTSRHFGPAQMRKLLHLGARSLRTHHPEYRKYFERKVAEGKPKSLVLNNIANKLVKIMCAVIREQKPYIPNYRSVSPLISKNALTKS